MSIKTIVCFYNDDKNTFMVNNYWDWFWSSLLYVLFLSRTPFQSLIFLDLKYRAGILVFFTCWYLLLVEFLPFPMFLARLQYCSFFCSCISGQDWASLASFERIFSIYWRQTAGKICLNKPEAGEKIATKRGKLFSFQPVPAHWVKKCEKKPKKYQKHPNLTLWTSPDFCRVN